MHQLATEYGHILSNRGAWMNVPPHVRLNALAAVKAFADRNNLSVATAKKRIISVFEGSL